MWGDKEGGAGAFGSREALKCDAVTANRYPDAFVQATECGVGD